MIVDCGGGRASATIDVVIDEAKEVRIQQAWPRRWPCRGCKAQPAIESYTRCILCLRAFPSHYKQAMADFDEWELARDELAETVSAAETRRKRRRAVKVEPSLSERKGQDLKDDADL